MIKTVPENVMSMLLYVTPLKRMGKPEGKTIFPLSLVSFKKREEIFFLGYRKYFLMK